MKWLLEPEVFQHDSDSLIKALESQGIDHVICKFGKPYEDYIAEDVIFHGSLQFAKLLKEKTKGNGVYCNLPKFECLYYYPRFGDYLLNSNYIMLPFGELNRRKKWIFDNIGKDNDVFLRPSSGFKNFTGTIISQAEWEQAIKFYGFRIDPEVLIVVAPPAEVLKEWRLVVVNNKVVAASQYKEDGKVVRIGEVPEIVITYGQNVLDQVKFKPDPAWVMDVCETKDSISLKVLEVGSFSCSGFYACDPEPIIKVIGEL
jgi:hypothetical protein